MAKVFRTVKELKDYLNSNDICDNASIYMATENHIHDINGIEVEFEIGGEPVVYITSVDNEEYCRDNYGEIDKDYWDEESHCFDKNGIWSPNGVYSAEGKTREEEDY